MERILSGRDGVREPHGYLHSLFCEEFNVLPSQLDGEDPELLYRIVQLRGYSRMRDAMRTEKERERESKPSGKLAELVARVQHALQLEDAKDQMRDTDDGDEEEG